MSSSRPSTKPEVGVLDSTVATPEHLPRGSGELAIHGYLTRCNGHGKSC
ncbi:hypothetical protein [Rhodococcus sp. AQ5-07]|nr:hypothetical protein [Rhodococcus sp. AQ5-07]